MGLQKQTQKNNACGNEIALFFHGCEKKSGSGLSGLGARLGMRTVVQQE